MRTLSSGLAGECARANLDQKFSREFAGRCREGPA